MAKKTTPKNAEKGLIIQTLDIKQVNRSSVDIQKWRDALRAAEGTSENRKLIYELYNDSLMDGHLRSVCDKRVLAITNSDLMFVKDGKPVDELWPLIGSKQLQKVLKLIVEAKLYGHSLIEFVPVLDGFKPMLVDRRHVKPRLGIVAASTGDTTGIVYREPPYSNFVLEVGEPDDFGLLLQACQYVIYKRGGFGDWADYLQLFGVPFRHGKYKNEETRKTLATALDTMGSSGWAVTPEDAVIEILRAEGATGANLVFGNFKNACNDEMSITILGQTMTTSDSGNAGYAQGSIHKAVEEELHRDDMAFTLRVLNTDLIPILTNLGYPVEGGEFTWIETDNLTLKERMEIDKEIIQLVPVDQTYLYEKYGIPVPATKDTVGGASASTPLSPQEPTNKNGKKLNDTPHEALSPFGGGVRRTGEDSEQAWFEKLFNFFVQASGR